MSSFKDKPIDKTLTMILSYKEELNIDLIMDAESMLKKYEGTGQTAEVLSRPELKAVNKAMKIIINDVLNLQTDESRRRT